MATGLLWSCGADDSSTSDAASPPSDASADGALTADAVALDGDVTAFDATPPTGDGGPPTWVLLSNTGMAKNFTMVIDSAGVIYVSGPSSGVVRSTDHGVTWSAINSGLPILCHYAIGFNDLGEPVVGEGYYPSVCTQTTAWQLYRLPKGTSTWVKATGIGNNITGYTSFWNQGGVNRNTGKVFIGGTRGEWLSSDHGASYTLAALPPDGHNAGEDLASYGDSHGTMWVGTAVDGIYDSTDNGATWSLLGFPPSFLSTDILWITEYNNKLEVAMGSQRDVWCYAPYFPPNSGTWTNCSTGLPPATMTQLQANAANTKLFVNSGSLGSVGKCGIFSSSDGSHWQPADNGIPPGSGTCGKADVRFIASDPTSGYFYAVLLTGEVYKTTAPQ